MITFLVFGFTFFDTTILLMGGFGGASEAGLVGLGAIVNSLSGIGGLVSGSEASVLGEGGAGVSQGSRRQLVCSALGFVVWSQLSDAIVSPSKSLTHRIRRTL